MAFDRMLLAISKSKRIKLHDYGKLDWLTIQTNQYWESRNYATACQIVHSSICIFGTRQSFFGFEMVIKKVFEMYLGPVSLHLITMLIIIRHLHY